MGIGPRRRRRWRARLAGAALGATAAALVAGSGASPLESAIVNAAPRDAGVHAAARTAGRRTPLLHRAAPIVGTASTPDGRGYGEVAKDGAIYQLGGVQYSGAAQVAAPAHPSLALANPRANVGPDPAYTFEAGRAYSAATSLPCWRLGASAWVPVLDASCLASELTATDDARAAEGLEPMRLPSDYAALTPAEQLFVLTDIERVSRREQPAAGLSTLLDGDAQAGAAAGDDPLFAFASVPSSDWWGSNVVSGALNALDANYTWMYADGYGGYNVDCTSPSSAGCWGHRDNELAPADGGTLVMGAGDAVLPTGLQSLSELLVVVQDPADVPPLSYTWADAVAAGAAGWADAAGAAG